MITYIDNRKGHDLRYAIDSTKLKHELGWYQEVDFLEGLRETAEWYLQNRNWWVQSLASAED